MHFERHADVYDEARPPYPAELWDAVRALGVLGPGRSAVDLGAGTGQATGPLIAAGMRVTAVEPGPELAARINATYPEATVVQERAETATFPDASFDLAVAATSIHWMDLDVVLPKVHRWLRRDAFFLVWRNVFGDPAAATTPFREQVSRIVGERDAPPRADDAEDLEKTSIALTRSDLFALQSAHTYRWSTELDADQVRRLFTTFSNWTAEEVERAATAAAELDRIIENYSSWLLVLQRQERTAP